MSERERLKQKLDKCLSKRYNFRFLKDFKKQLKIKEENWEVIKEKLEQALQSLKADGVVEEMHIRGEGEYRSYIIFK